MDNIRRFQEFVKVVRKSRVLSDFSRDEDSKHMHEYLSIKRYKVNHKGEFKLLGRKRKIKTSVLSQFNVKQEVIILTYDGALETDAGE